MIIFVLFVIGFLVLLSFHFFGTVRDDKKVVDARVFENDFKMAAGKVRYLTGTTKTIEFNVPTGFSRLCFIDWNRTDLPDSEIPLIIKDIAEGEYVENKDIFLIEPGKDFISFGSSDIKNDNSKRVACYNITKNPFSARLEGVPGGFKFVWLG